MDFTIREYQDADYTSCEALVNEAWGFDDIFAPPAFADLAKCLYAKGAALGSNYKRIVELDGEVGGLIFGLNQHLKKPGLSLGFRLSMLFRILRVKCEKPPTKAEFINAIENHELNRRKLINKTRNEIVLFVVGKKFKGKGLGTALWSTFLKDFKESGIETIVVETNKLGASSFYEQLGFQHLGDFDSPLHAFATPGGQPCIYTYEC